MRTAIVIPSLFLAASLFATAQQPAKPSAKPAARPAAKSAAARAESADAPAQLPVTRVSLYKNGVGFFEHAGRVTGDQAVTIDFTTAQLNDVLQSLTAVDLGGGRIAGADYNSTTPLDQQLSALPFSLGPGVTFSGLFTKLRGARVQVTGPGANFTGRIVDIEMHSTGTGKSADGMTEGRFLTLAADSGDVRVVEVTPAVTIRLLDTTTATNLTQFLKVLDANRSDGLRHLTLQDNGPEGNKNAARELHVSYLSEVPIWKSTYRILFTDSKPASGAAAPSGTQTATLQGWSVVDNTTGADWINVHLSLIAGAPQSFIQPLSVPYYSRRPEIGLPQEAQLTPQTHESGEENKKVAPVAVTGQAAQLDGLPGGQLQSRMAGVAGARGGGGVMGGLGSGIGSGSGSGIGPGSGGNYGGGVRRIGSATEAVAAAPLMLDSNEAGLGFPINGQLYQSLASSSIAPGSSTAAFDDYFAYNLTDPITIRKNESALVPILQTKINAERVTLWSPQQPVPLRALWITNTSDLTLDRGSFTIVENGDFGGEGLLDPIHPAEKRLLSYAVDQAVRITTESRHDSEHASSITAAKGVLIIRRNEIAEVTYVVHNAASDGRTVIVEHPIHQGFTLDSDPKPEETTPSAYRYRVVTAPGETVRLHVGERHEGSISYQLTNFNDNLLTFVLNQTGNSPAVKQALQPILDARRHVADMQTALDAANSHLNDLRSDEDRQRANITALAGADKASRDRFVHDLNATEDQIAAAQKDVAAAQANLQSAQDDLANRIASLQIDEKL